MSTTISKMAVVLTGNIAGFQAAMNQAQAPLQQLEHQVSSTGQSFGGMEAGLGSLSGVLGGIGGIALGAVGAVTAALAAAAAAIVVLEKHAFEAGDAAGKLSD